MAYRKFVADCLFTGRQMLDNHFALITDASGKIADIIDKRDAGEDIEIFKGILSPGLINCHCHLELSYLKGRIPENTGMVSFLLSVMNNRNELLPVILQGIEQAEAQMINAGIVAVGDICNTNHTLSQKERGNLYYHNFVETLGFVDETAGKRFGESLAVYETFHKQPASIVPHAPYSVSGSLFELINNYPGNGLLTMHNQESVIENEFFQSGSGDLLRLYAGLGIDISGFRPSGKSSLQTCLPAFDKTKSLILVHNVTTEEDDLKWIDQYKQQYPIPDLYWCFCPNANLYINNLLPDIPAFQLNHCKMIVGTDSLASNQQLDILNELKTLQRHFSHLSIAELLQWATINGAEALGIDNHFGSFEEGKTPGIIIIDEVQNGRFSEESIAKRLL